MVEYTEEQDIANRRTVVTIRVPDRDFIRGRYTELDWALMHDISTADDVTIADRLLWLAMIVRRIEQAAGG